MEETLDLDSGDIDCRDSFAADGYVPLEKSLESTSDQDITHWALT